MIDVDAAFDDLAAVVRPIPAPVPSASRRGGGRADGPHASTAHIEKDYSSLIDELAKHTTNILLAGLPPFEMSGELAGRYFDQASADRNNAAIRSLDRLGTRRVGSVGFAIAYTRLANSDRIDTGHHLAFRQVTVACDALMAVRGLEIGMLAEKVRDLGLDRLGQQSTRPIALDFDHRRFLAESA